MSGFGKRGSGTPAGPATHSTMETRFHGTQTQKKFLSAVSPPGAMGETVKTFVFRKEGHTLGNALRSIIINYPDVEFCGYSMPHPAEDVMHFRIQSIGTKALDVLIRGFSDLEKVCDQIDKEFKEAMTHVDTLPPDTDFPMDAPSPSPSHTFVKPKPVDKKLT